MVEKIKFSERGSLAENVRTSSHIVLVTSRGLQLPYRKQIKKSTFFNRNFRNPIFYRIFSIVELSDAGQWYLRGKLHNSSLPWN